MKRALTLLLIALAAAFQAGCAKPTAPPAPDPDAALLTGRWEQFIPVESLPQSITIDASGSAVVNGTSATWRMENGTLYIRQGGSEDAYAYTVSGYMLTLTSRAADASDFYINPDAFSSGADKNALFEGKWAAFSTFAMMDFDGGGGLGNIVYTTAGRTDLPMKYAARDGILQAADASRNYTYNLYSFSQEGALLLAETVEFDKTERRWTPYWKKSEPAPGLLGDWTSAFDTQPGGEGLPASLKLESGGKGSAAAQGASPTGIQWEYYNGGFAVLEYSDSNLQYAWCEQAGGVLSLANPDVDEAWYFDASRYKPSVSGLKDIAGAWKAEDTEMALNIRADGSVAAINDAGEETRLSAVSADGLMKLTKSGKAYYIACGKDGDTLKIYYGDVPFFDSKEMPVSLTKQ